MKKKCHSVCTQHAMLKLQIFYGNEFLKIEIEEKPLIFLFAKEQLVYESKELRHAPSSSSILILISYAILLLLL